ncbi:MAG: DUF2284 domain-containing protein [Ruminococcaceae bacterium]|nr:DUF2284 domain-containing protein [Oscillospiraceae bacterium]
MSTVNERLTEAVLSLGADRAAVIPAHEVVTDSAFRPMCEANTCGKYGKCYMCPPDVGEIDTLIASLESYSSVLVYQRVEPLEDSFDVEGMHRARIVMFRLAQALRDRVKDIGITHVLHLTAGACGVCRVCAKEEGLPCRVPDRATSSLEAYGIHVSRLAESAGMRYINGENTVTYFGAVFFTPTETEKEESAC